jgi:hypothetical protein
MQDPQPTLRKRLVRTLEWGVGIACLTLIVAEFVLTNLPKLSADVSGPIRPNDPMGAMFNLSNKGFLPVYDVKAGCKVMRVDTPPFRDRDFVEPITVYFSESRAEILSPGHKMTVPCARAIAIKRDNMETLEIHAEIFFVVTIQTEMGLVAQIGKFPNGNEENKKWNLDMGKHPAMIPNA